MRPGSGDRGLAELLLCVSAAIVLAAPTHAQGSEIENDCARGTTALVAGLTRALSCGLHLVYPASDATGLSVDEPGIRVDELRVAGADRFNVGDRSSVVVSGAASFGDKNFLWDDTPGGQIWVEITHGGRTLCRDRWWVPQGNPTATFHVSVPIEAQVEGTARFRTQIEVRGWEDRLPADVYALRSWIAGLHPGPPALEIEIGPPYRAEFVGPRPERVSHGEETIGGIRLHVETMADGRVAYSRVDSSEGPRLEVGGVAAPSEFRSELVHSKRKGHEGCAYAPPHETVTDLTFTDNVLGVWLELTGCRYWQRWSFGEATARDLPLPLPECPEDEAYDPDACDCVPNERVAFLLEVTGEGSDTFLPGEVDGIGLGSTPGAICGDDRLDPGEQCDGAPPTGASCETLGFDGGQLRCDPTCGLDTSGCTVDGPPSPPYCGDGSIDEGEACDGANLGGQTCRTLGFDGGTLACDAACEVDTSACAEEPPSPACGNGVLEQGEECDGTDLGGQTCRDLGFDQGTLACDPTCALDASGCSDQPQECALGFEDGERVPTSGNCGCGTLTASCGSPSRVRLESGSCQIVCDSQGDCGDENVINGLPDHTCTCTPEGCDCSNPQGGTCSMGF